MLTARWAHGPSGREQRLEAEVRDLRDLLSKLTVRLENLQRANEHMYAADYDRTRGPAFDRSQPFGAEPRRPLGTLPMNGGTA
ncbi:hypothetical protein [Streptomyces sp. NPDC094468]|uniref:hypothetical protein n=1 Tax=Streptomyces sp. NPDC094468 TaxID=3366066 RepID=UPI003813F0B9